jgi:tetratricopeptide (TPR) repeat protein
LRGVAERKDVLSTALWIATTWAYVRFVHTRDGRRYAGVIVLYLLAALAKPMIVTLPFTLLLLDYWPLRRTTIDGGGPSPGQVPLRSLLREKIPLFAIAGMAALTTLAPQRDAGALESLTAVPLSLRVANALVSYVAYIEDRFWPTRLAALYPFPKAVAVGPVIAATTILVAVTVFVVLARRRSPYLLVGWLWYLGTLLPVSGLVQAGPQARADRFTYIPHIGLVLMLVWGVGDLLVRWPKHRRLLAPVVAAVLVACAALSAHQIQYWRGSAALWEHTLAITTDNGVAHYNYGVLLAAEGRDDAALHHLREAVRLEPDFATAHNRLALALNSRGDQAGATAQLAEVVRLMPQSAAAYANLGVSLAKEGRTAEAIEAFSQAVLLNPQDATSRSRLEFLRRGGSVPTTP